MVEKTVLKTALKKIRGSGTTILWWADKHGFAYQTVLAVLHGYTGTRQIGTTAEIIAALRADGYLPKGEERKVKNER